MVRGPAGSGSPSWSTAHARRLTQQLAHQHFRPLPPTKAQQQIAADGQNKSAAARNPIVGVPACPHLSHSWRQVDQVGQVGRWGRWDRWQPGYLAPPST